MTKPKDDLTKKTYRRIHKRQQASHSYPARAKLTRRLKLLGETTYER